MSWIPPRNVSDPDVSAVFRSLSQYLGGSLRSGSGIPSSALSVDAVGEALGYRRVITDATASTFGVSTTTPQFTAADVGRVISANKVAFTHALQPGTLITAVADDGMSVTLSKRVFATGALGLCVVQSPVTGGFVMAGTESPWGILQDVNMSVVEGLGRVPGDVGYWVNLDVTIDEFIPYTADAIMPTGLPIPGGPGAIGLNVAGAVTVNATPTGGGMFVGAQMIPRFYNGTGFDGNVFSTYLGYVNQGEFFATGGDDLVVGFKAEADNETPWLWSYSASNIFSSQLLNGRVEQTMDAVNVRHIGYAAQNNTLHGARLGQNIGTWVQGGHSIAQEHFAQPSGHRLYLDGTTDPQEVDPAVWDGGAGADLVMQLSSRSVTITASSGSATINSSGGFLSTDVGAVVWHGGGTLFDGECVITEVTDSSTATISSPTNGAVSGSCTIYETLGSVGFAESGHIEIKVASYKDGPLDTLVRFNYGSLGLPDRTTYGLYGLAPQAWPRFNNVALDTDFGSWSGDTTTSRGYWVAGAHLMQPHYYGTVASTSPSGAKSTASASFTINVDNTVNAPESGILTVQASNVILGITSQSVVVVEYTSKDATHFYGCTVQAGYGNLAGGNITTHGVVDDNIGHLIDPMDRGAINSPIIIGTSSHDWLTRIDETGKIWSRNGIEVGSDRKDSEVKVYGDLVATDHAQGKYVKATGHGANEVLYPFRLVGSKLTPGAPTTGTWQFGDAVLDLSAAGTMYVCRVAGTPGTWDEVGSTGGSVSGFFASMTVTGDTILGNNIEADDLTVWATSVFMGSLQVWKNFVVGNDKFIVDYSNGNTTVDGILSVGGATTSGVTSTTHGSVKSVLAYTAAAYAFQAENYSGGSGAARYLMSSAAGSEASPTQLGSGRLLGEIAARGYTGSAWANPGAKIQFTAEEAVGASAFGASILFEVGKVGTATLGDALYVGYRSTESASEVRAERLSLGQAVGTVPSTTDALVNAGTTYLAGAVSLGVQLGVAYGGTNKTSFTTNALIAGGTTSTGALQNISNGTSGHFLKSAGTGSLPSFAQIAQADVSGLTTASSPTFTGMTLSAALAMGTAKITGLGAGTATTDAARLGQVVRPLVSAVTAVSTTGTTEEVLHTTTIPADTLTAAGDSVALRYALSTSSNSTAKRIKVYVGPNGSTSDTLVYDSGSLTPSAASGSIVVDFETYYFSSTAHRSHGFGMWAWSSGTNPAPTAGYVGGSFVSSGAWTSAIKVTLTATSGTTGDITLRTAKGVVRPA
jgi:hypothetical protein